MVVLCYEVSVNPRYVILLKFLPLFGKSQLHFQPGPNLAYILESVLLQNPKNVRHPGKTQAAEAP